VFSQFFHLIAAQRLPTKLTHTLSQTRRSYPPNTGHGYTNMDGRADRIRSGVLIRQTSQQ